jgi:predicted transcriptional regulator
MTITMDLPDELAARLAELLPEEERDRFAIAAIAEALAARLQDHDARLAASLIAEIDPQEEPEREAAECIAIVEEGLEDVDAGRNLISFEDARRQWEAEKQARQVADRQ